MAGLDFLFACFIGGLISRFLTNPPDFRTLVYEKMGASQSKTSLSVLNQSIIDVITTQMSNCSSNVKAVQDNTVMGTDIFGRSTQTVSLSQTCTQNIQISNDMIADMANKIQQQASAKAATLLPGYSGSANKQNLQNYLSSKITTQTIQNAMANMEAAQINVVGAGGITIGRTNTQNITSVQTALQDVLNNNSVAQGLTNDNSQSSTATTDTNPISQIFSAITDTIWGWIVIFVLFIAVIVVGALVLKKLFGSDAPTMVMDSGPSQPAAPQLSMGEGGILLGADGQPILDDLQEPIYVSPEGFSLDGPGGPAQMLGEKPVYVNAQGAKTLSDGTMITSSQIRGLQMPSEGVDMTEEELRQMEQVGAPEAI